MSAPPRHIANVVRYVGQWRSGQLDACDLLVDALTELQHFAGSNGLDADAAWDLATLHYIAETARPAAPNERTDA